MSWYRVWEAVTAVWTVCVRRGQGELITNLSMWLKASLTSWYHAVQTLIIVKENEKNLFLTLAANPNPMTESLPFLPSNDSILDD